MSNVLTTVMGAKKLRPILWTAGIFLCLLALLVGFLIGAFTRYRATETPVTVVTTAETGSKGSMEATGKVKELTETADAGEAYINQLTFLCDSALLGLRDYGMLSEGTGTTRVWTTSSGTVPVSALADFNIIYPADGTVLSPAAAMEKAKPGILVVSLGLDDLTGTTEGAFKMAYERLILDLKAASPDSLILVCSLTSVADSYNGNSGTAENSAQANAWIRQVCQDTGAWYADIGSAVTADGGALSSAYASANGRTLNSAGLEQVLFWLRTHAIQ